MDSDGVANLQIPALLWESGNIDALEDAKSKGHEFHVLAKPVAPRELIDAVLKLVNDQHS